MQHALIILAIVVIAIITFMIIRSFSADGRAQEDLDRYLSEPMSPAMIGRFYERYVGHLYENDGHEVVYYGAIKGFSDYGRDLIVTTPVETLIIQTKCWSKRRSVHEKDIYQLFGTMTHVKLTQENPKRKTRAVFYTTSQFTSLAKQAATALGVELRVERLNRTYPMIKCSVTPMGDRIYYMPFDHGYDLVKIDRQRDEHFVKTVDQAVKKGFKRAA